MKFYLVYDKITYIIKIIKIHFENKGILMNKEVIKEKILVQKKAKLIDILEINSKSLLPKPKTFAQSLKACLLESVENVTMLLTLLIPYFLNSITKSLRKQAFCYISSAKIGKLSLICRRLTQ